MDLYVKIKLDVGAADKAAIQLVRLRLSSAQVKSRHVSCPIQTCSDAIVRGGQPRVHCVV